MKKIKILAIAPYDGLKDLINDVAHDFKDLEVHTFVADMLDGVELAKSIQYTGYDAIISRAGTAELIREVSELPVIDIKLSAIDMMRSIKLAQNYSGKFAIVGYKSITETANLICELLQYDVEIKTISDISEILDTLTQLKENGVSLIVG
ncbi:MAG: Response regulator containing CheY-like receiver, AAA-type ATPase, and DNA-binding domain, partial [Clostridia bacterium]|nr:Response regulator containing CheY-like receiver, AAA-type ATPase, and DNA-binding domain [Clostridia bacterium]